MATSASPQTTPLSLYISYDYLPVDQYASALRALNGLYDAIGAATLAPPILDLVKDRAVWPESPIPWWGFLPFRVLLPPLCVIETTTGNSVAIQFDFERSVFPKVLFKDHQLTVLLPKWTAVLILVGAGLTYGLGRYQEFLEVQKTKLEIRKLQEEIRLMQPERLEGDSTIRFYIDQFQASINGPNIRDATINGVSLRQQF